MLHLNGTKITKMIRKNICRYTLIGTIIFLRFTVTYNHMVEPMGNFYRVN